MSTTDNKLFSKNQHFLFAQYLSYCIMAASIEIGILFDIIVELPCLLTYG